MKKLSSYRKYFVKQEAGSDCGACCLHMVIKYFGGQSSTEELRQSTGTTIYGATMLGIKHAASVVGLNCEGYKASIESLRESKSPAILHVVIEGNRQHFVVVFPGGSSQIDRFIVADPAVGVQELSVRDIEGIWQTKTLLLLDPGENFVQKDDYVKEQLSWFARLVKTDTRTYIGIAFLGVIIAFLNLAQAMFYQRLLDDILPNRNWSKLVTGVTLLFVLMLIKEFISRRRQISIITQTRGFNNRVLGFFFEKILNLPKPFYDSKKVGDITSRLNDITKIQRVITQFVGGSLLDLVIVILTLSMLFYFSASIGWLSFVPTLLLFVAVLASTKKIIPKQHEVYAGYARTEVNFISTIQGIDAVKGNQAQEFFTNLNNQVYGRYQDAVFQLGRFQVNLSFLISLMTSVFLLIILYFGSVQVLRGTLQVGELVSILTLSGALLPSITNLALLSISFSEARVIFARMFDIAKAKEENNSNEIADIDRVDSLAAENIGFRFNGQGYLFKDLSLHVNRGEIIGIIGENGCGKSTIAQLLENNYQPQSGQIVVNGKVNMHTVSLDSWRKLCSHVPQRIHLFNGTVLENLAFEDAASSPERVMEFLFKYGFHTFIDRLPLGPMTVIGEGGVNLSGGQRQIIGLARALYKSPQVLILDESTAAMDQLSEKFVKDLLLRIKKEMAIIYISHNVFSVRKICDRIYTVEKGAISVSGTHQTLMSSDNMYSRYWREFLE